MVDDPLGFNEKKDPCAESTIIPVISAKNQPAVKFIGTDDIIRLEERIASGGMGEIYRGHINNPFGLLAQRALWSNLDLARFLGVDTGPIDTDTKVRASLLSADLCDKIRAAAHDHWEFVKKAHLSGNTTMAYDHSKHILEQLQKDSMSEGTEVAVKVLKAREPQSGDTPAERETNSKLHRELVSRFYDEFRIMDELRFPGIVRTIAVLPETELGDAMVMEYVRGPALADCLQPNRNKEGMSKEEREQRIRLPLEQALSYVIEVAGALNYCHKKGVVHRDVKPGNIILTENNGPKITDFGIYKDYSRRRRPSDTIVGLILGSPHYMAPEQWPVENKLPITAKTDVFGLGATLFEMITGSRLLAQDGEVAIFSEVCDYKSPYKLHVRQFLPNLSDDYVALIDGMIAKVPDQRISMEQVIKQALALQVSGKYSQ